jgi:hypothetical protein
LQQFYAGAARDAIVIPPQLSLRGGSGRCDRNDTIDQDQPVRLRGFPDCTPYAAECARAAIVVPGITVIPSGTWGADRAQEGGLHLLGGRMITSAID